MAGRGFIAVGVVVLVSAGTGRAADNALPAKARAVLEKAETLDVYSLDPDTERDVTEERPKTGFRGWKILGKTTVQDADARKALLSALDKAVAGAPPRSKKCFEPRHGVRATAGGKTVDLVICFACSEVQVWSDGGVDLEGSARIADSAQPAFDKVLSDAKVPLPGKSKE